VNYVPEPPAGRIRWMEGFRKQHNDLALGKRSATRIQVERRRHVYLNLEKRSEKPLGYDLLNANTKPDLDVEIQTDAEAYPATVQRRR